MSQGASQTCQSPGSRAREAPTRPGDRGLTPSTAGAQEQGGKGRLRKAPPSVSVLGRPAFPCSFTYSPNTSRSAGEPGPTAASLTDGGNSLLTAPRLDVGVLVLADPVAGGDPPPSHRRPPYPVTSCAGRREGAHGGPFRKDSNPNHEDATHTAWSPPGGCTCSRRHAGVGCRHGNVEGHERSAGSVRPGASLANAETRSLRHSRWRQTVGKGAKPNLRGRRRGPGAYLCVHTRDVCFVSCMIYRYLIHLLATPSPVRCLGIFVRFGVRRGGTGYTLFWNCTEPPSGTGGL